MIDLGEGCLGTEAQAMQRQVVCRLTIQLQINGRLDTDKTTLMQYKAESKPFRPGSKTEQFNARKES